jgi:putative transcriptional regulator
MINQKKGVLKMPIVYDKLFVLLKEKGYSTYRIRKDKLIGQGTLTAIKNGTGGLDSKTIARLCETLDCQPQDIMEYVKEDKGV